MAEPLTIQDLKRIGENSLEVGREIHPTSSYWHAPLAASVSTGIEGLRLALEETGHPNWSNAISGLNGGPGLIGVSVDFFRLADGARNRPYEENIHPATRMGLAFGSGLLLGTSMIPDPDLRYTFLGLSAFRRSFVESLGYAFYGNTPVNHHVAMIAEGITMGARSFLPYWGNYPPFEGRDNWELGFNGVADTAVEVGWQFAASHLAVQLQKIVANGESSDLDAYPYRQLLPSLIPPAIQNILAQPFRLSPKAEENIKIVGRYSGFNLDPFMDGHLVFRHPMGERLSGGQWRQYYFLDSRPYVGLIHHHPFLDDNQHRIPVETLFTEGAPEEFAQTKRLQWNYALMVHELLHGAAVFGMQAQDRNGQWFLYGGEGPLLHNLRYAVSGFGVPHDERPGELAEEVYDSQMMRRY